MKRLSILLVVLFTVVIGCLTWWLYTRPSESESIPYVTSFLSPEDFQRVCSDFESRLPQMRQEQFFNVARENQFVPRDSPIYDILSRPCYLHRLQELMGNPRLYLARDHPVEYRRYLPGSFMAEHRDIQLYRKPQWECILTLHNTSDSRTQLYSDTSEGKHLSIRSSPNSVLFVQANGLRHEVLPIHRGERRFIKFILTETDDRIV